MASTLVLFPLALAHAIAAAELSFRFFEGPILRLKRKFSVVHQTHV